MSNIGLSDETVAALEARNIKALFPIQKHVFEPAQAGRDLIGRARTGSGKTLAFALPVIENLLQVNTPGSETSGLLALTFMQECCFFKCSMKCGDAPVCTPSVHATTAAISGVTFPEPQETSQLRSLLTTGARMIMPYQRC